MRLSAKQQVFLASAVAHGLLIALLSPWLTLVAGAESPPVARVQCDIVAAPELTAEPPAAPDLLPLPPEDLPPAQLIETVPPEEDLVEARLFELPTVTSLSTALVIPRERSIAVRPARRPMREPAPRIASAPPPVRTVAVSAATPRPAGLCRKARPVKGNPPPRYPVRAVERALQGVVLVLVHLDRGGQVTRVELLSGSGYAILDREALRAVGAWSFSPALQDGIAIPSRIEQPVRFRID